MTNDRERWACAFCGGLGKLTKEHAWPQWMRQGVEVAPHQHSYGSGFRCSGDAIIELQNVAEHHKRSVLTTVAREYAQPQWRLDEPPGITM